MAETADRRAFSRVRRWISHVRRRTWVLIGAVTAALIVGGITGAFFLLANRSVDDTEERTRTAEASLTTFKTSIEATGTLTPSVQESVSFEASGTVQSVDVAAGDTVTAGQKLATIDTLTVDSNLLQAQASLAEAQASLASAQESDDGSTSSTTKIAALGAEVTLAQENVADAEAATAATTLTSPVAGLVTEVTVAAGDAVSGTSSGSADTSASTGSGEGGASGSGGASGTTQAQDGSGSGSESGSSTSSSTGSAFTVVGTDAWSVDVSLGESDIEQVEVGDSVELVTDDDVSFTGEVSEVGKLPSTTSGSPSYTVSVTAESGDAELYDGTAVTATIITDTRDDVLSVPSSAVTSEPGGSSTVTLVSDDGTEKEQTVTVGETSGDLVEITDGLESGDQVLVTEFTPGASGGSGDDQQSGGEMPGGGEMPSGGEMPGGGEMPSGGQGGFPGGDAQ